MEKRIFTIFTRTPLHVGAGSSVGVVDSPIMRERHTRIPIIPGSSLKGVLASYWNDQKIRAQNENGELKIKNEKPVMIRTGNAQQLFGSDDERSASVGHLLVGEARVLAFPIRSAKGAFAWITCPLALRRFLRDGGSIPDIDEIKLSEMDCYAGDAVRLEQNVILEEYQFICQKDSKPWAESLSTLSVDPVWREIAERLVVLSDEMFSYFVEQACEVVTRIKIDADTGTVAQGALFNQEQVPSETMFYAVFGESEKGCIDALLEKLSANADLIQIGGDETIGLGYCSIKLV